jgi:cbb3-type cytochrome oxidase maturation protein
MDILYLLVPLSVVLVFLIGAIFWWALQAGQFEDLEGPAHSILLDDDAAPRTAPTDNARSASIR